MRDTDVDMDPKTKELIEQAFGEMWLGGAHVIGSLGRGEGSLAGPSEPTPSQSDIEFLVISWLYFAKKKRIERELSAQLRAEVHVYHTLPARFWPSRIRRLSDSRQLRLVDYDVLTASTHIVGTTLPTVTQIASGIALNEGPRLVANRIAELRSNERWRAPHARRKLLASIIDCVTIYYGEYRTRRSEKLAALRAAQNKATGKPVEALDKLASLYEEDNDLNESDLRQALHFALSMPLRLKRQATPAEFDFAEDILNKTFNLADYRSSRLRECRIAKEVDVWRDGKLRPNSKAWGAEAIVYAALLADFIGGEVRRNVVESLGIDWDPSSALNVWTRYIK